eukprot:gene7165-275_t
MATSTVGVFKPSFSCTPVNSPDERRAICRYLFSRYNLKMMEGPPKFGNSIALSRENTLSLASVMIMEYTNTMDPPPAYDIAKRNCDIFASSCRLGRYVKCRLAPKGNIRGGAPSRSSKLRVSFG